MAGTCHIDHDDSRESTRLGAILGAISGAAMMLVIHLALTKYGDRVHERTVALLKADNIECQQIVQDPSDEQYGVVAQYRREVIRAQGGER
jgi:hypothetical protein